jgi:hypothetical protein
MIPDLSDAAAPWWIEVRRESSRLGVGYKTAPFVARRFNGTVAITVRLDLIPALLSAIEELMAHPAVAAVDADAGQSWSARREGDEALLTGPGHVHLINAGDAEGGLARTLEVAHAHLAHLHRAVANLVLLDAGGRGTPPGGRRPKDHGQSNRFRLRDYPP